MLKIISRTVKIKWTSDWPASILSTPQFDAYSRRVGVSLKMGIYQDVSWTKLLLKLWWEGRGGRRTNLDCNSAKIDHILNQGHETKTVGVCQQHGVLHINYNYWKKLEEKRFWV